MAWKRNVGRAKGGNLQESGEARAGGELDGGRELAGVDLLAVGRLHARDLEPPVGADHREAVRVDRDDLAHLAGDALRILGGQRLGVKDLQRRTVERRPGAGRRVAATDESVDLYPELA